MWVYIEFENYLVQQKCHQDSVIFYLTDLVNIWISECNTETVAVKFRALNPLFDMTDNAIMTKVKSFYKPGNGVVHLVEKSSENLKLQTTYMANRFSMIMELVFIPSGPETLYLELYQHTFNCMNQLLIREEQLIDIIKSKDAEIEEYRLEGVEIKRRAAITTPFNHEEFQNSQKKNEPVSNPSSLFKGPLGDLLGRHTDRLSVKLENKEEETEEPVKKKLPKSGTGKFPVFESRGCLYKKDEDASNSKKRKYLKL